MDFNYFVTDGVMKFKRLPSPKGSVKIKDYTDLSILRDLIKDSNTEYKIREYYDFFSFIGSYEVEVEDFSDYISRNPKKFLGKLHELKNNYMLVEELFYWADDYYWNEPRDITQWMILCRQDKQQSQEEKLLIKLEKYNIIEMKTSSEKSDLINYIKSGITVYELDKIALNNITVNGKKDDKINQLIEAVEKDLIDTLSIVMYRPGKGFQKWFDDLQVKYVDEIEYAISTFDYPELYVASIWDEVLHINNEFTVIVDTINSRHKQFCDEAVSKAKNIAKKHYELPLDASLKDIGIDINIEYYDSSSDNERKNITKFGTADKIHKDISNKQVRPIKKEKNITGKTFIVAILSIMIIAIAINHFFAGVIISIIISLILVNNMSNNE